MISTKRLEKIKQVVANRQKGLAIILEDVHDPHNAAAILRTCDAFGIQEVHFIFDQEKPYNPKDIGQGASSSANKWLDFYTYKSTRDCLEALKKKGYKIYATVLNQQAKSLYKIKFSEKKVAILVGNEHRGLSPTAIKFADQGVYIPMQGMVQSLNVSVTAAIMIFAATNLRQKNKNIAQYSILEKNKLIKSFSSR